MRLIIQRVSEASVSVCNKTVGAIDKGLLVLLGFESNDTQEDIEWVCNKIINLRIFNDFDHKMNRSLLDIKGELLLISQFTLYASTKKGNRPSFINAAPPSLAKELYTKTIVYLKKHTPLKIEKGVFGATMQVSLINQGPVTILIDSKKKE